MYSDFSEILELSPKFLIESLAEKHGLEIRGSYSYES